MKFAIYSVAAVALVGLAAGSSLHAQENPSLLVQDSKRSVTVTGQAIKTDGQPAARMPAVLMHNKPAGRASGSPDLVTLQQAGGQPGAGADNFQPVGRQMTDESGRFNFRNVRHEGWLRLDIGIKERTDWISHDFNNEGKTDEIDLGELQLQPSLGGPQRGGGRGGR